MANLFAAEGRLPFDGVQALRHLAEADPVMARLIQSVGPLQLSVAARLNPFEALGTSIIYQQLHGKAAATILRRVCEGFPGGRFPSPEQLHGAPDAPLRQAGLSRNKLAALRDLAQRTLAGEVPTSSALRAMDDEDIVQRLTRIRGVGRWTVEMLLIFRLGRPDVLPLTDFGVRKGFTRAFRRRQLVEPAALARRGERWRPFRSVASWYLWRAAERGT